MAGERERLEQIAGSKIVPTKLRQAVEETDTRALIKKQALESGMSEGGADRAVFESGVGSVTPRLDRAAGEQRRLEESRAANPDPNLQGFKTYGDKARFETQNAVRKLQGLPQITPDTPQQFRKDIGTSMGFGEESALLTPEGQARAIGKGVKSGLSPEEAGSVVQRAFKALGAVKPKIATGAETPEQYGPPKVLAGTGTDTGTGTATTPEAATQPARPAIEVATTPVEKGLAEKFFDAAGPAVRVAGKIAPITAVPAALAARATQKATTLAAESAKFGAPSKFAAEGAAAQKELSAAQKGLTATSRLGGGKTPIAGSPYEKALGKWTQKTTEAAGKVSAAEEGAKTASKLEGAVAKAEAGAARAAQLAKFMKPIAGVSRVVGKVAMPLAIGAELYDTGRFIFSPEQREEMTREVEATAEKGALRSALGGVISPMQTILGTGALVGEALQSDKRARESAAALATAEKRAQVMAEERRKDFTDEEFKALPQKERSIYLKQLRERVVVK